MERGPRVGTVFAGYRIDAVLGQGGMGVVYRATHPRLGSVVAIKAMDLRLSRDESQRERFLHEAHVAASLNHPNVIPIFDAGYEGDELYIVMRYVAGADLGKVLRARGPLDVPTTAHLLRQAGRGLDAAHKEGLVHRDVKPANLLLEAATDELLTPTCTWRISGWSPWPKRPELRLGLPLYMAPEQIEGGSVDPRTDVYALGCVTYECLCGVPPFSREADGAVLWAHMQEDPTPPSTVRSDLPHSVDQAVARAMAKDPAERYQSCSELTDALSEPGDAAGRPSEAKASANRSSRPSAWLDGGRRGVAHHAGRRRCPSPHAEVTVLGIHPHAAAATALRTRRRLPPPLGYPSQRSRAWSARPRINVRNCNMSRMSHRPGRSRSTASFMENGRPQTAERRR